MRITEWEVKRPRITCCIADDQLSLLGTRSQPLTRPDDDGDASAVPAGAFITSSLSFSSEPAANRFSVAVHRRRSEYR